LLSNFPIGQYIPGSSLIHRLDARIKIILLLGALIILFWARSFTSYTIYFFYLLLTVIFSSISFRYLIRTLKPLLFLILLTFFINLIFTTSGKVILEWKGIKITKEGLVMGMQMSMRLIFLILFSSLLTLTTSPLEIADALEYLLFPLKFLGISSFEIAMMITIAIRFIPTLLEETERIIKAQMSRGADFESRNILKRIYNMVPVLVPLFVSAFRRADDLAFAMESRCYRGGEFRTKLRIAKIRAIDFQAILISLFFWVLVVFLR